MTEMGAKFKVCVINLISSLLGCFCSGPGAVGCHSGSVHGGRGCCPRSHQPHSETTQKGGAIISGTALAVET